MRKLVVVVMTFVFFFSLASNTSEDVYNYDFFGYSNLLQYNSVVPVTEIVSADSESEAEEEPEPEINDRRAVLSFIGDCTLGENVGKHAFADTYRKNGASWFFSGVVKELKKDDLSIANLEGALTERKKTSGSGPFFFRGDPVYTEILTEGSVELVNLSNNHTMNYGKAGYEDTQEALSMAGVDYFGNDDLLIRDVNGINIGFFGLKFTDNNQAITGCIKELKKQGADFIIASFHDGEPGIRYTPTKNQINAAQRSVDAGADLVIMHHPHVLQEITTYKSVPIAYSIGNFCYGGHSAPKDKDTVILRVIITEESPGSDSYNVKLKPLPATISSSAAYNDFRPKLVKGSEAKRILKKMGM